MSLEAFRLIDGSSAASLTFTGTPAVRLGDASLLGEALHWSLMGLEAETTGILATLNRTTFEYLLPSKQFGTSVAGFKARRTMADDMFSTAAQGANLYTRK